jgi:hypothetical protein
MQEHRALRYTHSKNETVVGASLCCGIRGLPRRIGPSDHSYAVKLTTVCVVLVRISSSVPVHQTKHSIGTCEFTQDKTASRGN